MRARFTHTQLGTAGLFLTAALALVIFLPWLAKAGTPENPPAGQNSEQTDDDHSSIRPLTPQERAIRLRESGKILPLAEVIRINDLDRIGSVIEVDLEEEDGRQLYELKILTNNGVVREYYIDPVTGRILEIE